VRIALYGAGGVLATAFGETLAKRSIPVWRASHRAAADAIFDLSSTPPLLPAPPLGVTHAVVCAALSSIDLCASDPANTRRFNVDHTIDLLGFLLDRGVVPVFCSSEAVFKGDAGPYAETDAREPTLEYGRQKAAVEDWLAADGRPALILRFGKLYLPGPSDTSPLGGIVRSVLAGQPVRAATDQMICPTHAGEVAEAALDLMEAGHSGVWHLVPPAAGRCTRYEMAMQVAQAVGRPDLVVPCRIDEFPFLEPRPRQLCLEGAKAEAFLGRRLSSFVDHLDEITR